MKVSVDYFQKLNTPEIFDRLAELNDEEIRLVYGHMHVLGYSTIQVAGVNRILDAIAIELKSRENRIAHFENQKQAEENQRGFVLMKRLTYIAISVSVFQALLQLFEFVWKR